MHIALETVDTRWLKPYDGTRIKQKSRYVVYEREEERGHIDVLFVGTLDECKRLNASLRDFSIPER